MSGSSDVIRRDQSVDNLLDWIDELKRRVDALERTPFEHYKGTSSTDFTTATLVEPGDYGYQTTDAELQMNCNGTVRAISTGAL